MIIKGDIMTNKNILQNKKLNELRETAKNLENKIKCQRKNDLKALGIRNLKIFGYTCNFLAPFVLVSGITAGIFAFYEWGLPFYKDDVLKYKTYSLDYQTNEYEIENVSYNSKTWHDIESDNNELIIYTPWEYENNQYIRYKRTYDVKITNPEEAFTAVKSNNYKYIEDRVKTYKEEKQIINNIDFVEDNDYIIKASLHMLNLEETKSYKESDIKNLIITIVELILGIGIGSFINHIRAFDYSHEVETEKLTYKLSIATTNDMKKELNEINQKIKRLEKKYEK